jgi:hypothetical protein
LRAPAAGCEAARCRGSHSGGRVRRYFEARRGDVAAPRALADYNLRRAASTIARCRHVGARGGTLPASTTVTCPTTAPSTFSQSTASTGSCAAPRTVACGARGGAARRTRSMKVLSPGRYMPSRTKPCARTHDGCPGERGGQAGQHLGNNKTDEHGPAAEETCGATRHRSVARPAGSRCAA